MEKQAFVLLPVKYRTWPVLRDSLGSLANKDSRGVDALSDILIKDTKIKRKASNDLTLLRSVLKEGAYDITEEHFDDLLLPWLAKKALEVKDLFEDTDHKLPNLYVGREEEVVFTRQQVCCILALAFFDAFRHHESENSALQQQFTLLSFLFASFYPSQTAKLLCMLLYFERIRQAEENKEDSFLSLCISVKRKKLDDSPSWKDSKEPLTALETTDKGAIEDAHGCLQVDFANEYIGGGVLGMGNVQEEIRFVINPECLVSLLVCEKMEDTESILITGTEQFTTYSGYGGTFICTGPYKDTNPVDKNKRRCVSIVAIDAIPFSHITKNQYKKGSILRELNKAHCGFSHSVTGDEPPDKVTVATGNWGCGVFGGDKKLKTIIQWLAASQAGRNVKYYTFDSDKELFLQQTKITEALLSRKMTVGEVFKILVSFSSNDDSSDVFHYITMCLKN